MVINVQRISYGCKLKDQLTMLKDQAKRHKRVISVQANHVNDQ